jgi:hypothetical protein
MPAIRNADDLCLRWRALMGPLGFGRPRLWIAFLEPDNMMSAPLTQIEDIPRSADSKMCGALLEMCRHVVGRNGASGSVAMLLTRPGRNPISQCLDVAGAFRERCRATSIRSRRSCRSGLMEEIRAPGYATATPTPIPVAPGVRTRSRSRTQTTQWLAERPPGARR